MDPKLDARQKGESVQGYYNRLMRRHGEDHNKVVAIMEYGGFRNVTPVR